MSETGPEDPTPKTPEDRRSFLARTSSIAMVGGLAAGYGTLGYLAGRYLYPGQGQAKAWLFVTEARRLARVWAWPRPTPTWARPG